AVMLSGHVKDIVSAARDINVRHVERLRIDVAVDGDREQLAKLTAVYVGRGEDRFGSILPRPGIVVVKGCDVNLAAAEYGAAAKTHKEGGPLGPIKPLSSHYCSHPRKIALHTPIRVLHPSETIGSKSWSRSEDS